MKETSRKAAAFAAAVMAASGMTACGGDAGNSGEEIQTTTAITVEINTETLAPEQEEQVQDLADTLTDTELQNKTIKWMSFYDPWHPTGFGNSKPVSVELFEKKYGGEIEYFPTTWASQYSDLSTYILGGEGIDFFPAVESIPQCVINGMTQSYDEYVDWNSPLWSSVKDLNDRFAVNGSHYLMACQATEGYVVYYNRKTMEENGFDDPKDLYEKGDWTLETFKNMLMEYVDVGAEHYGLDGWFNTTPLCLASGVPAVSLENGKVINNFNDPSFERAMNYQYDLWRNGLMLDKSLFSWNTQIQFIGEGKELFYIGGLYEIESDPEIWSKNFGSPEDVFFVPIPRDEQADKYYYNAEIDCYNLCMGAGNPEGTVRLMECVIASYSDENAQAISNQKRKDDYGWTDEMLEMKAEVLKITQANPMRDIFNGLPTDAANLVNNAVNQPITGTDWYSVKESVYDSVDAQINDVNEQLAAK